MNAGKLPLLAYFGHHKTGTRWIDMILESLAKVTGLRYGSVCNPPWFQFDLQAFAEKHDIEILSYTNAEQRYVNQLRRFRGFHVIRDPRDMAISAYFSHLLSHPTMHWPELGPHRDLLRKLPKPDGILADMRFTSTLPTDGYNLQPYQAMANWDYDSESVLELKFEELIGDPLAGFSSVLSHLGLDVPRLRLEEILAATSFEVLSGGRSRGQEDVTAHYRRGIPGDWRQHFELRHKDYFAQLTGDLAVKLGYAPS
jgi:hypothetical protein